MGQGKRRENKYFVSVPKLMRGELIEDNSAGKVFVAKLPEYLLYGSCILFCFKGIPGLLNYIIS